MKNLKALLFLLPFLLVSCGQRVVVKFSEDPSAKGKYNILPSRPLAGASLTVNGKLLIEQKFVKKITVENLPDGQYSYDLTCDNSKYQEKLNEHKMFEVKNGNDQSRLIETPPYSNGYWVNLGLNSIGTFAMLIFFWELD